MKNNIKRIGTSFQDAKETTLTGRGLNPWEQKVVDERTGKRKFHGAFTGGFVAGYKNTCGSETGFTPSTFVSNRNSRASIKQNITDFIDDEDLGEINLSSNVLETEEKLGEKLYQNMVSENRENYEYGPTMPPIEEALPKIDFFGLGFQPKNSENCKGKISKQKKNQSLFRVSNKIYDDDEIEEYEIEVKNNKNENLEKNTPQFSELSTEVPGFVLGLTVESEIKFSPPTIPLNYNPRTYFLQMKSKNYEKTKKTEKKYEKNTDKTEKNPKNDPLFSASQIYF